MAAATNLVPVPKPVRCAIYTRKSTDEGLNQEFNSLDAQREAAEAYIRSQRGDGWTLVPAQYSDGGYTGANIERPGVRKLLADIEAGEIDCVVVYKVDRLSRSLIDFAKMMGLFEQHGVCFVSVTQQFNTNTPLGRLTLNILLSFAQFEREIISDRTRDKQVAARKKGKWTGGHILLGYDLEPGGGKLVVNPEEAERVREMFRLYTEGTSVQEIVRRFDHLGWRNKQWTTQEGKPYLKTWRPSLFSSISLAVPSTSSVTAAANRSHSSIRRRSYDSTSSPTNSSSRAHRERCSNAR